MLHAPDGVTVSGETPRKIDPEAQASRVSGKESAMSFRQVVRRWLPAVVVVGGVVVVVVLLVLGVVGVVSAEASTLQTLNNSLTLNSQPLGQPLAPEGLALNQEAPLERPLTAKNPLDLEQPLGLNFAAGLASPILNSLSLGLAHLEDQQLILRPALLTNHETLLIG